MPSGYSSEQFYKLDPSIGTTDRNTTENRNEKFMWPGPIDKHVGKTGHFRDKVVDRGFIKMLTQTYTGSEANFTDTAFAKRQCFFQFNPQTIRRNVIMREDMMHPLLQDPAQFAVPVPGNATFAFDIMFDRSFELNRGRNPTGADVGEDILMGKSPDEIGVLHDMRILDGIVGQGISEELVDYIAYRGKFAYANDPNNPDNPDFNAETSGAGTPYSEDTVKSNLAQNYGNQAFLIPNPVRIVFSSLFMVDGFINNMDVAYVKFTENMVPSQVVLSVSMQAVYIGFARANTFLTWSLSQADPAKATPAGGASMDSPGTATGDDLDYLRGLAKHLTIFQVMAKNCTSGLSDNYDYGSWDAPFDDTGVVEHRTEGNGFDQDSSWAGEFDPDFGPNDPTYYLENDHYAKGGRYSWLHNTSGVEDVFVPGYSTRVKNAGRAHFPSVCGEKHLGMRYGFNGIPSFGDAKKDPIFMAFASGDTSSLEEITYVWTMVGTRKPLGIDDPNEKETDPDIELFSFSQKVVMQSAQNWKDWGHAIDKKVTNHTFTNKAEGDISKGCRLYMDTGGISDPGDNNSTDPSAWMALADKYFRSTNRKGFLYTKVNVTLKVNGGKTLNLEGTFSRDLFLDSGIWAIVGLGEIGAPIHYGHKGGTP